MVFDIAVVFFAFLLTYALRQNSNVIYILSLLPGDQTIGKLNYFSAYLNVLILLLFIWWIALGSCGLYESFRRKNFFEIVWNIIKSTFFVMLIFSAIAFIFKLHFLSRTFVILSFFIASLLLIIERWLLVALSRYFRKMGYNYRNLLLVGTGARAEKFIKLVHKHEEWGLRIVGLIDA